MAKPIQGEVVEAEKPKRGAKPTAIIRHEAYDSGIKDLMSQAVATGNMDTIERVFALYEKDRETKARAAFFDALSHFQANMPKIPKNKRGYDYWYAPLGTIEEKIRKPMQDARLSKRWEQVETGDQVTMTCVIAHAEGHEERASIGPVGWDFLERTRQMNALQHRAATITYLQRYTLIGALGLATDDDTDGKIPEDAKRNESRPSVSQPRQKPTAQKQKAATPAERVHLTPAQAGEEVEAATIKVLTSKMELAALGSGDFKKRFGLDGLEQVKRTDLQTVLGWIIDPINA